ncbi:MAG: hypothetical protein RIR79_448 [Pseudomonadota bacterium]|jgi:uncharacterized protein YcfJ
MKFPIFIPIFSKTVVSLVCVASLSACVSAPRGPHVAVMPTPGKSLAVFQQEDQYCRNYASQSLGNHNANDTAIGAAIVGTVFGAAIGAALGGRHGAGTGAATGLMMGTMAGAGASASEGYSAQRRYDIAYQQCMSTMQQRSSPPPIAPSGVYPPPPGVQPPPPSPSPSPY